MTDRPARERREVEITPEMIEAGIEAVSYAMRGKGEPDGYDEIAAAVYRAMERARLGRGPGRRPRGAEAAP